MDKKIIRKEILSIRNKLKVKEKEEKSCSIYKKFFNRKEYRDAKKIFMYISYSSEINTRDMILKAIDDKKEVYVPRINNNTKNMDAVKFISFDNLMEGVYGILEPSIEEPFINPNELDLILVPGVAFDNNKGRMGYGAGYYDRYFKKLDELNFDRISKIALAYDFQIIDEVPMDENDVPVDCIITNEDIIE